MTTDIGWNVRKQRELQAILARGGNGGGGGRVEKCEFPLENANHYDHTPRKSRGKRSKAVGNTRKTNEFDRIA